MKLKQLVAATMSVAFICSPAFAAHGKKAKMKRQEMMTASTTYKDMGALPVCPHTDLYTVLMDRMHQNVGRAKPTVGCDNPISFAGGINFDAKWGNRSLGYMGENNQRLSLNDAYLNIYGNVNDYTTAFMSLSYQNFNDALVDSGFNARGQRAGLYSAAYGNGNGDALSMEQAFMTFRNWSEYPIYVQLGKQFQDFGRYTIHPMTRTMDQVLSETLRTSAEIGFIVPMGVHGSLYVFDNPMRDRYSNGVVKGHTPVNFGAALGVDRPNDPIAWDAGIGYLYNMTGVNDVAYGVGQFNGTSTNGTGNYQDRVSALALFGDVASGPFSLALRYVTAMQSFAITDLGNKVTGSTSGAKPWAAGITAAYGFMGWNKSQNVWLGFQTSREAVNLYLPKGRWLIGYGIDMWKNTNFGLEFTHNYDYGTGDGATGDSSNALNFRAAVKFG
jgi:hypothetical protein